MASPDFYVFGRRSATGCCVTDGARYNRLLAVWRRGSTQHVERMPALSQLSEAQDARFGRKPESS